MSQIADWMVGDLLTFLAHDLEPDGLLFYEDNWWIDDDSWAFDVTALVDEAVITGLLWKASGKLHFTGAGIEAVKLADVDLRWEEYIR